MSEAQVSAATAARSVPSRSAAAVPRKARPGRLARPQAPVSRDAQRFAAAILEVLAGVRTPTEAAVVLGLSLPRYYLWEQRALEGLVRACEPRPKGKAAHERHQVAALEKEVGRLRLDCARQQALVRASQRTIGLAGCGSPVGKPVAKAAGKAAAKPAGAVAGKAKRKRRPVARALKAVAALQTPVVDPEYMVRDMVPETAGDAPAASSVPGVEVVQRSVSSSSPARAEAACAAAAVLEA